MEILHDLLQRLLDAEDLFAEEVVVRLAEAVGLCSAAIIML